MVATEHSLGERALEGRPLTAGVRALYLATERLGTTTVAVSATVEQRLRRWGVPASRLCTVPNGIDAARFRFDPAARAAVRSGLGLAPDAFVVAGVGRLVAGKRFDTLVDAVAALPGAHLLLAGDGPELPALRAARRGAGGRRPGTPAGRVRGRARCRADTPRYGTGRAGGAGGRGCVRLAVPRGVLRAGGRGSARRRTARALRGLPGDRGPAARAGAGSTPVRLLSRQPCRRALRGALARHAAGTPRAAGPARLPVPPVVHRYDIARCAERLALVYRAALGTPPDGGTARVPAPGTASPVLPSLSPDRSPTTR